MQSQKTSALICRSLLLILVLREAIKCNLECHEDDTDSTSFLITFFLDYQRKEIHASS